MATSTPEPVVSGVPYEVREVDGRAPTTTEDFVGAHTFVALGRTGDHVVTGDGAPVGTGGSADEVRFHEKAADGGKDVRVWCVQATADGFVATVA